ncbi:MAG: hypothetical protein M1337_02690 [Actinobacteria bacterium]|nr:hypothetical protein [Actinomycetota bacterium]
MLTTLRTGMAATVVAFCAAMGVVVGPTAQPAAAFVDVDWDKAAKKLFDQGAQVGKTAVGAGRLIPGIGTAITVGTAGWMVYSERDALLGLDFCGLAEIGSIVHAGCTLNDVLNKPGTHVDPETGLPNEGPYVPPGNQAEFLPFGTDGYVSAKVVGLNPSNPREIEVHAWCNVIGSPTICYPPAFGSNWATHFSISSSTVQSSAHYTENQWMACRNTSTNSVVTRRPASGSTNGVTGTHKENAPLVVMITGCLSGEVAVGLRTVPQGSQTFTYRQNFSLGWGTLVETPPSAFPEGTLSFDATDITVTCRNGVTGEVKTITERSQWSVDSATAVMPACKGRLGEDWYMTKVDVLPALPKIDGIPIPDSLPLPDFVPDTWIKEFEDPTHPDWQPCETNGKGCSLTVWIDNAPCEVGKGDCVKFEEIMARQPERVGCRYGSRWVSNDKCLSIPGVYSPTKTGTTTGTTPTTNPPGGTQFPAPPMTTPAEKAAKDKCFPTGWGVINPVQWVYMPVVCALEWAFKPQTALSTRLDRMTAQLHNRAPFSWVASIASLPSSISGGGCPTNWAITVQGTSHSLICGTRAEGIMRAARPVFLALAVGAAVYPFIRSLVYASTPVVKPVPS